MKVLVLNMDYSPINITTLQRGFKLVFKGKAEIVTHQNKKPIKTERKNFKRPTVIRLLRYIVLPFRKVSLNRQNIYRRDNHKCIYCGSKQNQCVLHNNVVKHSNHHPDLAMSQLRVEVSWCSI